MQLRNYKVGLLLNKPKHLKYELDMGKSCIRFKRMNDILVGFTGDLLKSMEEKIGLTCAKRPFVNGVYDEHTANRIRSLLKKAASSPKIECFVYLYFGVDAKMYLGVYNARKFYINNLMVENGKETFQKITVRVECHQ